MPYHDGSRQLQDRFDSRRLADRLEEKFRSRGFIDEGDKAFIEARDMFFLATADAEGRPQCSYKGGEPGFVRVLDEHTLTFPDYDGNGMFLSTGNILVNPHVGLLFIDFTGKHNNRVRVNGRAVLDDANDQPGSQLTVKVAVDEIFPNCARYIHRLDLVERSKYIPQPDTEPPVPNWKQTDWARDVLPESRSQP